MADTPATPQARPSRAAQPRGHHVRQPCIECLRRGRAGLALLQQRAARQAPGDRGFQRHHGGGARLAAQEREVAQHLAGLHLVDDQAARHALGAQGPFNALGALAHLGPALRDEKQRIACLAFAHQRLAGREVLLHQAPGQHRAGGVGQPFEERESGGRRGFRGHCGRGLSGPATRAGTRAAV
jgi:hypothetical protein